MSNKSDSSVENIVRESGLISRDVQRTRVLLMLLFWGLATVAMVIGFVMIRNQSRKNMRTALAEQTRLLALQAGSRIERAAGSARETVKFIEEHPDAGEEEIYDRLIQNLGADSIIYGSCMAFVPEGFRSGVNLFAPYVHKSGDGIGRVDLANASYNYTEDRWEWFARPMKEAREIWTEPYFDDGGGDVWMVTFSAPFRRDAVLRGVQTVDIELEGLGRNLGGQVSHNFTLYIIDEKGRCVFHPDQRKILKTTLDVELARLQDNNTGKKRAPWVFQEPIPGVSWTLVGVIAEREALASNTPWIMERALALAGGILVLLALLLNLDGLILPSLRRAREVEAIEALGAGQHRRAVGTTRNLIIGVSVIVMLFIGLAVGAISFQSLYGAWMEAHKTFLSDMASTQASVIDAAGRLARTRGNVEESKAGESTPLWTTLRDFSISGTTGEVLVAREENGRGILLTSDTEGPTASEMERTAIPIDEPMRRALQGQRGVMVARDYRGIEVLAAYQPVGELSAGLVAKLDLSASRGPFRRAAMAAAAIGFLFVLTGGLTIVRLTSPLLRRVQNGERQFRGLVDNLPGATYRCRLDKDWTMIFISDAIERIVGFPASDFIENRKRSYESLIHVEDRPRVCQVITDSVAERRPYTLEYRIMHANATVRWVSETGQAFFTSEGRVSYLDGAIFDVTERKQAQDALETAREAADAANQAKSEFLANMSHEIRTPMNAILGFSEILRKAQLAPKEKSYLDAISTSGRALMALINDILDLSKVEAGRIEIQPEIFDFRALARDIQMIFTQRATEKGIELRLESDETVPDHLFMDEVRLRQILVNLVGNAIKFTEQGSVTLRLKGIPLADRSDRFHLRIEIQDTGIGIPGDQQSRIFESFTQVSGQSNRKYGGTGLGLAISKRLTEMMDGQISVESQPGQGTTFALDFPEAVVAESSLHKGNTESEGWRLDRLRPSKILYADDEFLNRELLKAYFEGTPHQLILVENGEDAVAMTREVHPDAVLMDIRMPGIGGIEASRQIKSFSDVPVLALTASTMDSEREIILRICNAHLSKPINPSELAHALSHHIPVVEGDQSGMLASGSASVEDSKVEADHVGPTSEQAKQAWIEMIGALSSILEGDWKNLVDAPNMDEVGRMAGEILRIGEQAGAEPVTAYARNLATLVDEFEICGIQETLGRLPAFVAELESKVRQS